MNQTPSIFLVGYGGANNTGAEIRILTIIDDIRAVFGDCAYITVGTVSKEKTLRVLSECETLRVVQFPSIFPRTIWRLTRQHDLVMLVEGSTFKDNWSSVLLYLFLWAAWCAHFHGRRCIAYAVDAGRMSRFNRWLTRRICGGIDLIITRTEVAREALRALGVMQDIVVTTDTAFQFQGPRSQRVGDRPVVGLAPIEFYQWPVRFRLWGRKEHCYQWPYYFSWDNARRRNSHDLVSTWADLVRHIVEDYGWQVQLFAMEELDQRICNQILERVDTSLRKHVSTVYAGDALPHAIVGHLRVLDYLVTSRYHACVLSMAGHVPQMALYHDERLISIFRELGLDRFAISYHTTLLGHALLEGFDALVQEADWQRAHIANRLCSVFLPRCSENRAVLRDWGAQAFGLHMETTGRT